MSGDTWFKTGLAQTKKTKLPEQFRLFKMKNKGFLNRFSSLIRFYILPSFVAPDLSRSASQIRAAFATLAFASCDRTFS